MNCRDEISHLEERNEAQPIARDLVELFRTAEEREAFHVNPRLLAERLNVDIPKMLTVLVRTLSEGLTRLHWEITCSACGAIDGSPSALCDLTHDAECKMCQAKFSPHLDDEVSVSFSVHEGVRKLSSNADDLSFRRSVNVRLGRTAGQTLLLLPEYRRLFPKEALLPHESLEVKGITVVFTDLEASTSLYEGFGDSSAFQVVRKHFDVLSRASASVSGSVIKTIGDAVMAAFENKTDAIEAALAMQIGIAELNKEFRNNLSVPPLSLKVGVHTGPSLSVNLNGQQDYFGSTVNIGARVQALARGGEIVLTDEVLRGAGVDHNFENLLSQTETVKLRGIQESTILHRIKFN